MGGLKVKRLVEYGFYGWAVVSLILMVFPICNYLEFYPAIRNLFLSVESFSCTLLNSTGEEKVRITSTFVVFHNSSFIGLEVFRFNVRIFYEEGVELVSTYLSPPTGKRVLGPYSAMKFLLNITLSDKTLIGDLLPLLKNNEPVEWTIYGSIYLYIFGNPYPQLINLNPVELVYPSSLA
ncbi:hypothetical protein J7K27_09010 [Candidatus Bathyarchaeota archaeon]|nr:hypothetical protein [Candidatus Bathyarchaeota archaeon]